MMFGYMKHPDEKVQSALINCVTHYVLGKETQEEHLLWSSGNREVLCLGRLRENLEYLIG